MRASTWIGWLGGICCLVATAAAQEGDDDASDAPEGSSAPAVIKVGQDTNPTFTLDPHCTDMHACIKVRQLRGTLCHSDTSLGLQVTNTCKKPVAVGICIEQADHTWDCASHARLGVGQTNKKSFTNCNSTGTFRVLAALASEQARQPCFSGAAGTAMSETPGVAAPAFVPGPYLGICARVKACCHALSALPGAASLQSACEALDGIPDEAGAPACGQILVEMQRAAARTAGVPAICH